MGRVFSFFSQMERGVPSRKYKAPCTFSYTPSLFKASNEVLDVGCGIGGPLRELVRFSRTLITGLNNKFLPNIKRKRA